MIAIATNYTTTQDCINITSFLAALVPLQSMACAAFKTRLVYLHSGLRHIHPNCLLRENTVYTIRSSDNLIQWNFRKRAAINYLRKGSPLLGGGGREGGILYQRFRATGH